MNAVTIIFQVISKSIEQDMRFLVAVLKLVTCRRRELKKTGRFNVMDPVDNTKLTIFTNITILGKNVYLWLTATERLLG